MKRDELLDKLTNILSNFVERIADKKETVSAAELTAMTETAKVLVEIAKIKTN